MQLSKLTEKYPKIDKRLKELKSLSKEDLAWVLKGFLPPEKKPTRPPTDYEIFIDTSGLKPAYPYCTSRLYRPHGLDDYGMPKLSGVVRVDETYFRENQKGAMELVNVAPTAVKARPPPT